MVDAIPSRVEVPEMLIGATGTSYFLRLLFSMLLLTEREQFTSLVRCSRLVGKGCVVRESAVLYVPQIIIPDEDVLSLMGEVLISNFHVLSIIRH